MCEFFELSDSLLSNTWQGEAKCFSLARTPGTETVGLHLVQNGGVEITDGGVLTFNLVPLPLLK